jgi:hypothetical protein
MIKEMKTSIKMQITSFEQSEDVQKIVFANGGQWHSGEVLEERFQQLSHLENGYPCSYYVLGDKKHPYLLFSNDEYPPKNAFKSFVTVSADYFIKTNGTCEE